MEPRNESQVRGVPPPPVTRAPGSPHSWRSPSPRASRTALLQLCSPSASPSLPPTAPPRHLSQPSPRAVLPDPNRFRLRNPMANLSTSSVARAGAQTPDEKDVGVGVGAEPPAPRGDARCSHPCAGGPWRPVSEDPRSGAKARSWSLRPASRRDGARTGGPQQGGGAAPGGARPSPSPDGSAPRTPLLLHQPTSLKRWFQEPRWRPIFVPGRTALREGRLA